MLVKIEDIKVKNRVRKDLGDLEPLKNSLRTYGLLNPVTLNSKYELIAGERRLEAAKAIGWEKINANILDSTVDKIKQLEIEIEENNQRKEFTDEELMNGYLKLEKLNNPNFFVRLWNWIKNIFATIGKFFKKLFSSKR